MRALADAPGLAAVRQVSLSGTLLTAAGVDALINGPHWRLTGLGLSHCNLGPDAVRVLAESPRLARLTYLDLSESRSASTNPFVGRNQVTADSTPILYVA